MATRAMNFKLDETDINDIKQIASVYHITSTDVIREAVREYVEKMKADPFYKLTVNAADADEEETKEILEAIDALSDDDLTIAASERVTV